MLDDEPGDRVLLTTGGDGVVQDPGSCAEQVECFLRRPPVGRGAVGDGAHLRLQDADRDVLRSAGERGVEGAGLLGARRGAVGEVVQQQVPIGILAQQPAQGRGAGVGLLGNEDGGLAQAFLGPGEPADELQHRAQALAGRVHGGDLQRRLVEALTEHVDTDDDAAAAVLQRLHRCGAAAGTYVLVHHRRREFRGQLPVDLTDLLRLRDALGAGHHQVVEPGGPIAAELVYRGLRQLPVGVPQPQDGAVVDPPEDAVTLRLPEREAEDDAARQSAPVLTEGGRGEQQDGPVGERVDHAGPGGRGGVVGLVHDQVRERAQQLLPNGWRTGVEHMRCGDDDVACPCEPGRLGRVLEGVPQPAHARAQRTGRDDLLALQDTQRLELAGELVPQC